MAKKQKTTTKNGSTPAAELPEWIANASAVDTALAGTLFGIPPATITLWARKGEISAQKVGTRWLYSAADIRRKLGTSVDEVEEKESEK